ncbi:MAG TPA: RNA polymerase sigma factor SigF [Pseudonocardiaceae bacterium]|jgi:RNA polymerase sigma-B factor|nr:RNA polymerase sigma factor SigF [Pseudonocardiaceae bacterium]
MTATEQPGRTNYDHLAPLFNQLADNGLSESERSAVRERLVAEHLPVAEHIARRFANRGQPVEDLTQVAAIGLVQAVDRFDPERGTDFLSFAVPTITGEIRRYFRDSTWSVRVPRRLKELNATISAAATTLGQRLGRAPRASELAVELGLPIDEIHEGLAAGNAYRSDSLDEKLSHETGATFADRLGTPDEDLLTVENREALYPALATLAERERTIVVLRFFGNLTQTQIAERVNISQMHVSRLLATSLAKLRRALDGEPTDRRQ